MKKIISTTIIGYLAFFTSCSDFLEPDSTTEYTPTQVSSLEEMLLEEAYPGNNVGNGGGYWGFLNYLDDDLTTRPYILTKVDDADMDEYQKDHLQKLKIFYSWTADYETALKDNFGSAGESIYMYNKAYKYIKGANAALDYIDKMKGSENEKHNVRAQAYAMRAFHYFHLANIYGTPYNSHPNGLAVPLKLTSKIEEGRLIRRTVKECYAQIEEDFLNAEKEYLAMGSEHVWKANYRTNIAMVRLMLSRLYLYMESWEESAKYAKLVMDDPTFSLHDLNQFGQVFDPSTNRDFNYLNFIAYNDNKVKRSETIWVYGYLKDGISDLRIVSKSGEPAKQVAFFNASQTLLSSYNEMTSPNSDLRIDYYIVSEINKPDDETTYPKRAYGKTNIGTYDEGRIPNSTGSSRIFGKALRLSEAYLNYSEAVAMMTKEGKGSAEDALTTLNTLRAKRIKKSDFISLTSGDFTSNDDLINFIRNERRRELCFEGHRWFDLRRYGMPEITHIWIDSTNPNGETITLPAQSPSYAIKIPQTVLQESGLDPNTWQE